MKFRITLFVIISGIFIPINSVNANSTDRDDYNFYKGSFSSVCAGYAMNFVSEKNNLSLVNAEFYSIYVIGLYCPEIY